MKNRIYIKDLKLKEFKELVHSINKADKTEFNNKYDMNNPYYTDNQTLGVEDHQEVINKRLKEIDKKDIQYIEKQANYWGKTLIEKDLLEKLKNFDFWKNLLNILKKPKSMKNVPPSKKLNITDY